MIVFNGNCSLTVSTNLPLNFQTDKRRLLFFSRHGVCQIEKAGKKYRNLEIAFTTKGPLIETNVILAGSAFLVLKNLRILPDKISRRTTPGMTITIDGKKFVRR